MVELDRVVVDVLDHLGDLDPVLLELFELHPRHGPGGVLEQDLVDAVGDRLAGLQLPSTRCSSRTFSTMFFGMPLPPHLAYYRGRGGLRPRLGDGWDIRPRPHASPGTPRKGRGRT